MGTKKKFYGWIPILSGGLIIGQNLFQDADIYFTPPQIELFQSSENVV